MNIQGFPTSLLEILALVAAGGMGVTLGAGVGLRRRALSWRVPHRVYRLLAVANAVCIWFLIVLGGVVRVTESGRGCSDSWPKCNGRWLPALEYHQLIEWNHRLAAFLVGWLTLLIVSATVVWYRRNRPLFWFSLLLIGSYVSQAILGAVTVWFRLDHKLVAAHMGVSMLLLGAAIMVALLAWTGVERSPERVSRGLWRLTIATLLWTYVAMLTGSAVVGADANLACPAWPHCSDAHLLPRTADQWLNFGHRGAVGLSDLLMLALTVLVWRTRVRDRRLMVTAHLLAAVYILQVFVGAFTIWLGAPPAIRAAHLALSALTWGALVVLAAFMWLGRSSAPEDGALEGPERARRKPKRPGFVPESVAIYYSLMKPRIIPLLLVPTVASMLIAAVQQPPERSLFVLILLTMLGGTLATGGAHAINQYLDRDLDARMRRTKGRAVVTGRVSPGNALRFGVVLSALAFVQLWLTVNPVAAVLALSGNLFYVFVYTMWLKRTSTQNIVIGGAAGAVPPLVGWAAVTGGIGLPAILFFAIIFFWTPAHFWALALVRQDDYRAAGLPMLPVVRGEATTRVNIFVYTVLVLAVTILPFLTHALGWVYFAAAMSLGLVFVYRAGQLLHAASTARAWKLFMYSNMYLALLYLAMVVDRLLAL